MKREQKTDKQRKKNKSVKDRKPREKKNERILNDFNYESTKKRKDRLQYIAKQKTVTDEIVQSLAKKDWTITSIRPNGHKQ